MLMKVSDLDGRALNWAVAYALCGEPEESGSHHVFYTGKETLRYRILRWNDDPIGVYEFNPRANWIDGGHLIQKYQVHLRPVEDGYEASIHAVYEDHPDVDVTMHGLTPLQATCLCIVKYCNRCSDEIEIPDELCEVTS